VLTSEPRASLPSNRTPARKGPAAHRPKAPSQLRPRPASRRGLTFWVLVALVAILCLIGVVMVLSASSIVSLQHFGSPWYFFERQLMWLTIGILGFLVAVRIDPARWRRLAPVAMYATLGLLVVVLVPGIGTRASGASRWLGTSSIQIQPAELAKLALVVFAADILDRRATRRDWRYQMGPVIAALVLLLLLIMAQPDMGTAIVLACIGVAMMITAGIPFKPLAVLLGGGAMAAAFLAVAAPYRWRRLTSFLHPFKDASNTGYQSVQALLALSHGHVLGEGLGASIASYGYLPNAQTDFIFAVIGEETGLVGGLVLTGLFLSLALVGTRITCRAPSRYAALVAAGVTAWLVSQAVINIGAVVGLLPVTGVPLPFVSFGGSSLVIAMIGAGMLANIAKQP
jgi:cell division protein FtsW